MTDEEVLRLMLAHRGYQAVPKDGWVVITDPKWIDGWVVPAVVLRANDNSQSLDVALTGSMTQHHVRCQCGEPLIRYKDYTARPGEIIFSKYPGGWPPDFGDPENYAYYEYRAVAAGPASDLVKECPSCHVALDAETVQEIADV
jgi:hypothetical protein